MGSSDEIRQIPVSREELDEVEDASSALKQAAHGKLRFPPWQLRRIAVVLDVLAERWEREKPPR